MRRQSYQIGIALVFFSCGLTISAVAEPIVPRTATLSITRGELTFDHDSDDPFARGELFGVGFSLFLDLEQTDRFGGPPQSLTAPAALGTLRIDAAELDLTSGIFQMEGSARPTRHPRIEITRFEDDFFGRTTYPFNMSATLFGRDEHETTYRFNLQGAGVASTFWFGFGAPVRNHDSGSVLDFGAAAATPESPTSLLTAVGVLLLGFFSRDRLSINRSNRVGMH